MIGRFGLTLGALIGALSLSALDAGLAHAHIKLLKPASWIQENDTGDPQKEGPCGSNSGTPTNMITEYKAGEKIMVEWTETVGHPGFFRIALVENRDELMDPPIVLNDQIDGFCNYPAGAVSSTAVAPVLLDNLFPRTNVGLGGDGMFMQEVTLPNKPCEKCTLQLIQFMTNHTQPCIYYHCADIKIVAAGGTAGTGTTAGSGGQAGATAGSGGVGGAAGTSSGQAGSAGSTMRPAGGGAGGRSGSGGAAAVGGGSAGAAGAAAGAGGSMTPVVMPPAATTDSGCATFAPGAASAHAGLWAGLLLLGLRRARRKR